MLNRFLFTRSEDSRGNLSELSSSKICASCNLLSSDHPVYGCALFIFSLNKQTHEINYKQ
jgi:hypothetical protein